MAKRKQLNKNMVAFLTAMGMVLVISVAALVIRQGAQRDPEVLAEQARALEAQGDPARLEDARRLYMQAYAASDMRETRYLLDMARCTFEQGAFGPWLNSLQRAHAKDPENREVLVAALEGLWQVRELAGEVIPSWARSWRDMANALLRLDTADHPLEVSEKGLGLVCRTQGLWHMADVASDEMEDLEGVSEDDPEVVERYGASGDAAAQAAFELAPRDPRVALTYIELQWRLMREDFRRMRAGGATARELVARRERLLDESLKVLVDAVRANPADPFLVLSYVENLRLDAKRQTEAGQANEAEVTWQTARAAMEAALAANGQSPELNLGMARHLVAEADVKQAAGDEAAVAACLEDAVHYAERSIALDPAMYESYVLRSRLALVAPGVPSLSERYKNALKLYEQAQNDTLMLEGKRAQLTEWNRLLMLYQAFGTAMSAYEVLGTDDPAESEAALAQAEGVLDVVQTRWPENAITRYMQGRHALAKGDSVEATRAFEAAQNQRFRPSVWLQGIRVDRLPAEQLALLYERAGQLGVAQEYADDAIRQYEQELAVIPPVPLILTRASLYRRSLDQPRGLQQALDLLDRYASSYSPIEQRAVQVRRAEILNALGRSQEAERAMQGVVGDGAGPAERMWQAQLALQRNDFAAAAELARSLLDDPETTVTQYRTALQYYVASLHEQDQEEQARVYVRERLAGSPREDVRQLLQTFDVILSESDPAAQQAKLEAVIAQNPDPYARAEQFADYYETSRVYDKVLPHLKEMRALRPDDLSLVAREFRVRLRLNQFDEAAGLVATLAQSDGGKGYDQVGGATYRAELAMARGDADLAVREYMQAKLGLPASAELETKLGRAYIAAGRFSEAVDALRGAIDTNPRHVDAYGILTDLYDDLAERALGVQRAEYERLAAEAFASLAHLSPENPYVVRRQRRDAEDADPQSALPGREERWATQPDDIENIGRLGELYRLAWEQVDAAGDADAAQALAGRAEAFFTAVIAKLSDTAQLEMVQSAAAFYSASRQRDKGEAFLRAFRDEQHGSPKVMLQLLLGRFLETQNDANAAELEFQHAQAMVSTEVTDAAERERIGRRVGGALMEFYKRWRRPEQVVDVCRWMLDRSAPESESRREVLASLIDALLDAGQMGDAEQAIARYLEQYEEDLAVLVVRARLNLALERRDAARADLTKILEQNPQNVWALLARAWLAMQRARYNEAREDLMQAKPLVALGSRWDPWLRQLLIQYHEAVGEYDLAITEARARLEALTKADARSEQVQQVVGQLGGLLRRTNQLDKAQQLVSEYMERYPDDLRWPMRLGQVMEWLAEAAKADNRTGDAARDYTAAAGYYQRAVEKAGADQMVYAVQAMAARIEVLIKAGQPRDAINYFRSLPIKNPAPVLRLAVATAYWELNERDAAQAQWQQALLDAASTSTSLVGLISEGLRDTLLPGDAEVLLRAVVQRAPADSVAALRLRIALADHLGWVIIQGATPDKEATGREALSLLNSVLAVLAPTAPERRAALLARARLQEIGKHYDEAIASYQEVLELDSEDLLALNNLAYLLVMAEDPNVRRPQAALEYAQRLDRVATENPNTASMLDTVAWVYYEYAMGAGRGYNLSEEERRAFLDRAAATLEHALTVSGRDSALACEHLGQVYSAQGRAADARKMLNRGLNVARAAKDEKTVERITGLLNALP